MADHEEIIEVQPERQAFSTKLEGVVIGVLVELPDSASPVVAYPGNPTDHGVTARTTASLKTQDIGRQVALMFENGDPIAPLVIGLVQHPLRDEPDAIPEAKLDNERIELKAEREIVLRCGKASITLTRAGKVIIRGAYLLSRSSGANRIKGGSIQLN